MPTRQCVSLRPLGFAAIRWVSSPVRCIHSKAAVDTSADGRPPSSTPGSAASKPPRARAPPRRRAEDHRAEIMRASLILARLYAATPGPLSTADILGALREAAAWQLAHPDHLAPGAQPSVLDFLQERPPNEETGPGSPGQAPTPTILPWPFLSSGAARELTDRGIDDTLFRQTMRRDGLVPVFLRDRLPHIFWLSSDNPLLHPDALGTMAEKPPEKTEE
ncbi:hypothetical protein H696_00410 [Fonticula alba]|uniref:Uncharacterized protein n=1 Tax=Fonticula alba TaxID=691883 RepID=A0A058ZEN7_FONAL|nr:hypothetical protein H696_00410 [Fonticula alba]KCV72834.1 hypothetical protein H696_00410 [Fonticula alba]|eukprot:XP_009492535.1 hypothetical protein H696_00410 [Fonticula alba]